ncbi:MAG: hypothetical protein KDA53_02350 [Hyphomonas sp.]|nr:hypothetical protein [Hyphomonas sp.]
MRTWRRAVVTLLAGLIWPAAALAQVQPDPAGFSNWAVGIVAADWRDSEGGTIEAFENAKTALTKGFESVGFRAENITSLSLRPNQTNGWALASEVAFASIASKAAAASSGCLLYFTSHGSPEGIVLGREGVLGPGRMNSLVTEWCGERPTVVVVSACYSGVFVPALAGPNRLVMTAARPDRSSFGCEADFEYTVFDGCVLQSLPEADDFVDLSSRTRRCVAGLERRLRLTPSEPQSFVGADVEDLFIFQNFSRPPPE